MNKKQRVTLEAIFNEPVNPSIKWQDIENLLMAIGCDRKEGSGSRVRYKLNNISLYVHRPHPRPVTKRYTVRDVRDFLTTVGIKP